MLEHISAIMERLANPPDQGPTMTIIEQLQDAVDRLNAMADSYAAEATPDTWDSGLVYGLRQGATAITDVLKEQK